MLQCSVQCSIILNLIFLQNLVSGVAPSLLSNTNFPIVSLENLGLRRSEIHLALEFYALLPEPHRSSNLAYLDPVEVRATVKERFTNDTLCTI